MRKQGLIIALLLLTGTTAALQFDVDVSTITSFDTLDIQYQNRSATVQNINLSVENTGSIGCNYRIRADFKYNGSVQKRYSEPYSLWPGEETRAQLYFLPENYTGMVETTVYSTYCGQEKKIGNLEFNSTQKNSIEGTVNSTTIKADKDSAKLNLPVKKGLLVPSHAPPYWKTSASKVVNNSATVEYEPPIFREEEEINYTVIADNGTVLGTTTVRLESEVEPSIRDKIWNYRLEILLAAFFISILTNIRQFVTRRKSSDRN